jgi:hypothetical protein
MKQLILTIGSAIFLSLGSQVQAKAVAVTYLSSDSNSSLNYQITFSGGNGTLVKSVVAPCHFSEPCQKPETTKHDFKIVIEKDESLVEGPKIINIGKGYSLHMFYNMAKQEKSYLLFLPHTDSAGPQQILKMNLEFDIIDSKNK